MKMSLVEKESYSTIKDLWTKYHASKKDCTTMSIDRTNYQAFAKNVKAAPSFIYPLRRKGGHFLIFGQAQDNTHIFTYLEDFKKQGMLAQPYMVATFYEEL